MAGIPGKYMTLHQPSYLQLLTSAAYDVIYCHRVRRGRRILPESIDTEDKL